MEKGILENHTDEVIHHLAAIKDTLEVYRHLLKKDLVRHIGRVEHCQDVINWFKHIAVRLDDLAEKEEEKE